MIQPQQDAKIVMISSTSKDLPAHRAKVEDACLRQNMFPKMMEHLHSSDSTPIEASLQLVDQGDIYLGVIGRRYGYIPPGCEKSITEMEYDRALQNDRINRVMFLMDEKHPPTENEDRTGDNAEKLARFRDRISQERVVQFFDSPDSLWALAINSLSHHRSPLAIANLSPDAIPGPKPEPWRPHRYTLLSKGGLIGRHAELEQLTQWVKSQGECSPVLNLLAMGGSGKSALTWHWFENVAPEVCSLAGRMWWSFYEEGADFDQFVTSAVAYTNGVSIAEAAQLPRKVREEKLMAALDREPFLIVLDGVERLFIKYQQQYRSRAASQADKTGVAESVGDEQTSERNARERFILNNEDGSFLCRLTTCRRSRILISTREFPADLQASEENPIPIEGCASIHLRGLTDDDALALWRRHQAQGSPEKLRRLFKSFGSHPLYIQTLAGHVARDRRACGDYDQWLSRQGEFNPFALKVIDAKSQVLRHSIADLDQTSSEVLNIISAFRKAASFDRIAGMLAGLGRATKDEADLVKTLDELENRGLIGWDTSVNRYDMHPIVRGVAWSQVNREEQILIRNTFDIQLGELESLHWRSVEDLQAIEEHEEKYFNLIDQPEYEAALELFAKQLNEPTLYSLAANRLRIEMLEPFFPDGLTNDPLFDDPQKNAFVLNALGQSYFFAGFPNTAAPLFQRHVELQLESGNAKSKAIAWRNLSDALVAIGRLYEAELAARRAVLLSIENNDLPDEAESLCTFAQALLARNAWEESIKPLERALSIDMQFNNTQGRGVSATLLAFARMGLNEQPSLADRLEAETCAQTNPFRRDHVRALRLRGIASTLEEKYEAAEEALRQCLRQARLLHLPEEELPALIALVRLRLKEENLADAARFLSQVWEPARQGGYKLFESEAEYLAAEIDFRSGDHKAAVQHALTARQLATCDGAPYALVHIVTQTEELLRRLGEKADPVAEFNSKEREPMPEIEIRENKRTIADVEPTDDGRGTLPFIEPPAAESPDSGEPKNKDSN